MSVLKISHIKYFGGVSLVLGLSIVLLFGFKVQAGSNDMLSGYAWSDTIGWISFNSTNNSSLFDYGVDIDEVTGNFSGYAWSDTIGWISFESADVTGCLVGTCVGHVDLVAGGGVTGWAKALGGGTAESGGWDGWISLSCLNDICNPSNYQVSYDSATGNFSGYAWGSDVVGWVDFSLVTAVVRSNLTSDSLTVTGTFESGSTLSLEAGFSNKGSAPTDIEPGEDGSFNNVFEYRFGDNMGMFTNIGNPPGPDTLIPHSTLQAGESRVDTETFTIPVGFIGDLYIQHCVDHGDSVTESVEATENCYQEMFTVTAPVSPTIDSFQVKNTTDGGSWVNGPLVIDAGDQIDLKWESSNASDCTGTFFAGTKPADSDTILETINVTEPTAGDNTDYQVNCGGTWSSKINVSTIGAPTLISNDYYVPPITNVTLNWDTKGNPVGNCSLTGPGGGITLTENPVGSFQGENTITIYGESTYRLHCNGGGFPSAVITIGIEPKYTET